MPRLHGPRAARTKIDLPPVLASLPAAERAALQTRVEQLLFRWKPQSDSPDGLHRDLLALIAWALEGCETPPHIQVLDIYDD